MAVSCRIHLSQLLSIAGVLGMPGCSGEESFALPPPALLAPSTRYQGACRAWAVANCVYQERCPDPLLRWESTPQCIERTTLSCELMTSDPGVSFSEDLLRGCTFPIDCAAPPPNCWLQGTTAAGKSCLWDEACHSGRCFGGASALGICGYCVCDMPCPSGQECRLTPSGSKCLHSMIAPGKPCISSNECQSGACLQAADGVVACAFYSQSGDPCADGKPLCDPSAICVNGVCQVTDWVGFGDRCDWDPAFPTGARCSGFGSCLDGGCVPPAGDGMPCNQGADCAWPAECIDNQCVFPSVADCSL